MRQYGGLSGCSFVGPKLNWLYIIIVSAGILLSTGLLAYLYFDPLSQTDCNIRDKYILYAILITMLVTLILTTIIYFLLYRAKKNCAFQSLLENTSSGYEVV